MARPGPTIIHSVELCDGSVWDILQAESYYAITYKGKIIGVRRHNILYSDNKFKYQKLSYTNSGGARAQARRLNDKFNCLDFDFVKIY